MQQDNSDIRAFLLAETFRFIDRVAAMPGIKHIAIIGSLTTTKADPKDADILVTVEDDADLTALAAASRRLKGLAQSKNKGADIFLANPRDSISVVFVTGANAVQVSALPVMLFTVGGDAIFTMTLMILDLVRQ